MRNVLIILAYFLSTTLAYTQSFEPYFIKINDLYEQGEYPKAIKQVEKLEKKLVKTGQMGSGVAALALLKKGQSFIGLGLLDKGLELVDMAVELSEKVNANIPQDHAFMLKDAAEVYINYGHFRKAGIYIDQSKEIFERNGLLSEDSRASFEVMEAATLVGKGFYKDAVEKIDQSLNFFKARLTQGDKKQNLLNKKEYASILVSRANALRKMGDFLGADSSFVANERWIAKEINKKDISYGLNTYLNGLLLEENGVIVDKLIDFYETAYKQVSKDYAPGHTITMEVRSKLTRAYYKGGKKSKLIDIEDDLNRAYKKFHKGTNSLYVIEKELLAFEKKVIDQQQRGVENEVANILYTGKSVPKFHQKRIELLNVAFNAAIIDSNKLKNAEAYLDDMLRTQKELLGEDAPEYHLTKVRLANFYVTNTDKFEEAKIIYTESWEKILKNQLAKGHPSYIEIVNHLAAFYAENDEFSKASEYLDEAQYQARRKWDNQDMGYAQALDEIAKLEIKLGNYAKAREYLNTALAILAKQRTVEGILAHTNALTSEIPLLLVYGEYDQADKTLAGIDKMREKNQIKVFANADVQDDFANLFLKLGRYEEAKENLDKSILFKETRYSKESRHLIRTLVTYAQWHLIEGDYAEAEQKARRAYNIAKKSYGSESTRVTPSLITLASMYKSIGDYSRAEQILQGVLSIQEKKLGPNHVDVAMTLSELALVKYYISSDRAEVESLFRRAEQIVGSSIGASNPLYADILKNLAIVNISSGDFAEAESYLDQASSIWGKRMGTRNNANAALVEVMYGDIRYSQRNYKEANKLYSSAQKKYEKLFSESHPEYLKVQSKLAKVYYMEDNLKASQKAIESVLNHYQSFIRDFFPALGEREKAKFWNTIRSDYEFYNSVITKNRKLDDENIGSLYNNALLTKALLLNSSIKVRERIMSSGNNSLIELYKSWVKSKEQLTVTLAMSQEEITALGIDIPALTSNVDFLEKELSVKSEDFKQTFDSRITRWDEVRNALAPGEVAVEMVRFRQFDHQFTDEIRYAVLYVESDQKAKAKMVYLENGKEMETKYLKIYRNSIKYKVHDTYSYKVFWQPLERAFGKASTIYLSPDGVYNQINLESIPLPSGDGLYVLDKANIILVSNTKDLFTRKIATKRVQESKIAAMFGNPTFYVSTKPGRKIEEGGAERSTSDVITQLPGTEKEILELHELLGANGWKADQYTEYDANEGKLKQIDNPRIFHIATHGFFKADDSAGGSEDVVAREIVHNPLMRSGLLLTGAGDILNVTDYNFNINDGILTAYEAMNLNLDQTELVVLSACETGLGEIEAGEGVFGLQRAFLVAGAKAVVMSLFKVSDDATQKLMIRFYEKWLETGDIRQSFIDAKKDIRAEYVDPIYWGPFVMIGLNNE